MLSEDFGKMVFLQNNRTLEFHAPYGRHYQVRIPKFGRDMIYDQDSCDLVIGGAGNELYRLNLDKGQFMAPFASKLETQGTNVLCRNSMHPLLVSGGEMGIVECWDMNSKSSVSCVDVGRDLDKVAAITALEFHGDGKTLAVGTSSGDCLLYDIRSSKPLLVKSHQYGMSVFDVRFHQGYVMSSDPKIIKIWNSMDGEVFTNIEPTANINSICIPKTNGKDSPGSGLILATGEQQRIQSYYIPQLHHAPKWCSFLDTITEELEEQAQTTVYENYKFVTQKELESLGLQHLKGTTLLKAYMHGFFMDSRLYNKIQVVSKPQEYKKWRKEQIQAKVKEAQANRITIQKRLPKVNRKLAEQIIAKSKKRKDIEPTTIQQYANPLGDDRFSKMFTSDEFQVDVTSDTYKQLHPTTAKPTAEQLEEDFDSDQESIVEDDEQFQLVDEELEGRPSDASTSEDDDDEPVARKQPKLYALNEEQDISNIMAFGSRAHKAEQAKLKLEAKKRMKKPLAERLADENALELERSRITIENRDQYQGTDNPANHGIVREMSFIPQADKKHERQDTRNPRAKRGVQDLKLAKPWNGKGKK